MEALHAAAMARWKARAAGGEAPEPDAAALAVAAAALGLVQAEDAAWLFV